MDIKNILESACLSPSADNLQPWLFLVKNNSIKICYDKKRVSGKTFPFDHPATLLSIGCLVERINKFLNFNNIEYEFFLRCCEDSREYVEYHIIGEISSISNVGKNLRHTNRFKFKKEKVPEDILIPFSDSEFIFMTTNKERIDKISNLIKAASEIRFQIKEVHEWLMESLRFSDEEVSKGDGLDVKTIDLPPGGKYFMKFISDWKCMKFLNNIKAYKAMAKIDSKPVKSAPLVVEIYGEKGIKGGIQAGMELEKVWTYLNENNIAVQPYFVVTDQLIRVRSGSIPESLKTVSNDLVQKSEKLFGLNADKEIYMLLRAGYACNENPVRSKRLGINEVSIFS